MASEGFALVLSIGGAAGQGIATPGNILTRMFVRRGLHFNAYNAYQSIIRGGHIFLTIRVSDREVLTHGDSIDLLLWMMGPVKSVFGKCATQNHKMEVPQWRPNVRRHQRRSRKGN